MPIYKKKNWAKGTLMNFISFEDTTMEMNLGHTLPFEGSFPVVIWDKDSYPDPGDDPNVEVAIASFVGPGSSGGDLYALIRGVDDTAPSDHGSGSTVALNVTAELMNADKWVIGNKEVDETGITDLAGLVYDVLFGKIRYKPIMVGLYDNDLNMFLLMGASNLNMYHVEFIGVVEWANVEIVWIDAGDEVLVWDHADISIDALNLDVADDIEVIEIVEEVENIFDVIDWIEITEGTEFFFDSWNADTSENVTVAEDLEISIDLLNIETFDSADIAEMTDFSGAEFNVGDGVTLTEDAVMDLLLELAEADDITIGEDIACEVV